MAAHPGTHPAAAAAGAAAVNLWDLITGGKPPNQPKKPPKGAKPKGGNKPKKGKPLSGTL